MPDRSALAPDVLARHLATNRPFRTPVPLTLTVGQDAGALRGSDDKAIQAGIDYLHRLGGGVLQILPGVYTLHNAIHLRPNLTLRGSGASTVLTMAPSVSTPLVRDADWYEYAVQVREPDGFVPGHGLMLSTKDEKGVPKYLFATITAVQDDVIFFDRRTEANFWLSGEATASTLFSLLAGRDVDDVRVEDLVLDGNREACGHVNDNYGAAVFLQYCNRWAFRQVTARNYHGDGFSFQVCDDIHFEDCQSVNNADLGFHPGSGSQRPRFQRCTARGNSQGLFFCWGVSDGVAEDCILAGNGKYGISIGHRDTDNRVRNCRIEANGEVGILFRQERQPFFSGDRNGIEGCVIRDNGSQGNGVGIDIRWVTREVTVRNCRFEDPSGRQAIGVRIGAEAGDVHLAGNTFAGAAKEVEDQRPAAPAAVP